jgi:hypothetical protein
MKKLSVDTAHPNYVAKVVKLKDLRKHPNADALQLAVVDYQIMITSLDAKPGDLYVYFPVESQLNADFIRFSNAYSKPEMNADPEAKKGFFDKNARVRCVRLRGTASDGYLHPLDKFNDWLATTDDRDLGPLTVADVGTEFTHYGNTLVVQKYIPQTNRSNAGSFSDMGTKKSGDRLVDGQFTLHGDTKHLKREMSNIYPDDVVSVRYKMHGSNMVIGNVLTKSKLDWKEKIAKFFGLTVPEAEYSYVWSSRNTIKNRFEDSNVDNEDSWNLAAKELEGKIEPGITLYGELVGQNPNGAMVQKDYDYGYNGTLGFHVFRITYTSPVNIVYEFNTLQVENYCEKHDLKTAPLLYYGKARQVPNELYESEDQWREAFIETLSSLHLEKRCFMCNNKVPAEGVVVRKENAPTFTAYKLKSMKFLEKETKDLDEES